PLLWRRFVSKVLAMKSILAVFDNASICRQFSPTSFDEAKRPGSTSSKRDVVLRLRPTPAGRNAPSTWLSSGFVARRGSVKTDFFRCDDGVLTELSIVMVRIVCAIVSTSALLPRQSGTCNQETIQLQVPGLELAPATRMCQWRPDSL